MEVQFGLLFAAMSFLLAAYSHSQNYWALSLSAAFGGLVLLYAALQRPECLSLPANLWLRLGRQLALWLNPILIGVVFVVSILPVALILRIIRKELLQVKLDSEASTYWVDRLEQPCRFADQY